MFKIVTLKGKRFTGKDSKLIYVKKLLIRIVIVNMFKIVTLKGKQFTGKNSKLIYVENC